MLAKKTTIAILPCDRKLTEDMTKWDSAQKIGTASTAQYKDLRRHDDAAQCAPCKKKHGGMHDRENDHESIKPSGDKPKKG